MGAVKFVWEEISQAIKNSPETSSVYVGADSKVFSKSGTAYVAYVTVVILHYGSSKGAKIFKSYKEDRYYGSIKQRLLSEVYDVLEISSQIADIIGNRAFEIHLDINPDPKYKSSQIVKEATGYVLGTLGFAPKLKPDAFAASSVADRLCVKRARKLADSPSQKRRYLKKSS